MFLSTSINVLFTHDPTSYVAFFTISCLNKGFVVVVVVVVVPFTNARHWAKGNTYNFEFYTYSIT